MRRALVTRPMTYLRKPIARDSGEFTEAVRAGRDHLQPFIFAPEDDRTFRLWIAPGSKADTEQFLICRRTDDAIAGFINLNNIVLGGLRSAAAGWAAFPPHHGHGHLRDGLSMTLEFAFTQLGLHRVEANIQPANERSRRLAVGAGMSLEGFSPRYLQVGGEWRDHERWAILSDTWRDRTSSRPAT